MNDRATKWAVAGLFVFLYVPFVYQHGYLKAFIDHGDFPTIYWASQLAFVEQRSPYAAGAFDETAARLNRHLFPYLYPPPSLLAFYPFALVSYGAAKLMLLAASHAGFLLFLYLFFRRITGRDSPANFRGMAAALVCVYVLTYYPVVDNFAWGQINLIVLALVAVSWYALKRGGPALAVALPLSVAILLKTYPLLLLPLLLVRKRYAAAAWVVGLVALYAAVTWVVLPRSLWAEWLTNVLPTGGYGQRPFNLFLPVAPWNHSINGFWTFVQDRLPPAAGRPGQYVTKALTYLCSAAVAAVTVGLSYRCSRRGDGRRWLDLEFALFLQMMFLVAPLSWEHHLVYLLPAALLAVPLMLEEGTSAAARVLVSASLAVAAWDFPRDEMFHFGGVWALAIPVKFYAAFALWAWLAKRAWDAPRESPSAEAAAAAGGV